MLRKTALAAVVAGAFAVIVTGQGAFATHEPANKAAAAGAALEEFDRSVVLLQERLKVSSPYDLILQLTSECSIVTELTTGGTGAEDFSEASGSVQMWITIDGEAVPVQTGDIDPDAEGTQEDDGKVTFCNRTYGRSVEDADGDGNVDQEDDYIRTKNANAFNWLALNVGTDYDKPDNGNNIVDVVVHAAYETSEQGRAIADAFVGKRTLILEATNASVHEQVEPSDPEGGESGDGALPLQPPPVPLG